MDLRGVHVPLVTPFDDNGVVDTKAISHITEVMIANGISGIVAAGTTGEAYALNFEERQTVIDTIVKQVHGRVPVLAGVGGMSTKEAIKQAALLSLKLELKSCPHYIVIIAYHGISFFIIYLIFKSQFNYSYIINLISNASYNLWYFMEFMLLSIKYF